MKEGRALIYLNNNSEPIPEINIESFEFVAGIDEILPKGVLRLKDLSGKALSEMKGLAIGSEVKVKVVEVSNENQKNAQVSTGLCTLMIASIAEAPDDLRHIGGILEILLVHPWIFCQDYSCHLYKGIPNSEIIKKILEGGNRNFVFVVDDDTIEKSDESGEIPRYKSGQSDKDFIINNLLPYTTINNSPVLFWIGTENDAHLHSAANLFSNDPFSCATAFSMDIGKDETLQKIVKEKNFRDIFLYTSMQLKIGDLDIDTYLKPLKSKVLVEGNNFSGAGLIGTSTSKVCIGKDSGSFIAARTPFLSNVVSSATDCKVLSNRNVKDQTSFLVNTTSPYLENFTIKISGNFCGDMVSIGEMIEMYVPGSNDNKKKLHWVSGKWLVSGMRHSLESKKRGTVVTTLTLIRPSFLFSKSNVEVQDIDEFYGVKV